MTTVGQIELLATIDTSKYKQGAAEIERANKNLEANGNETTDSLNSGFSKVAKVGMAAVAAAAVAVGVLITKNIGNAVKRVDTLNNSARTFANMGFATDEVRTSMQNLEKSIMGLPTSLDQGVRGMQSLAATYGDIDKGQKVFTALNNAIIGFGGTSEEVGNAVQQLSQLPMDGPLDAQTWNSLRNSGLTPVLVAIAKDMGMGVNEMKEKFGEGELKVRDFTNALTEMNTKGGGGMKSLQQIAKDATSGIGTGWTNMQTAITRGIANIIQTIGASNISNLITNIGVGFESALKSAARFVLIAQQLGSQIGEYLAPKIGELWFKFQQLLPTLETFYNSYLLPIGKVLGTTLVVAIGLAIEALTLLVTALKPAFEWLNRNKVIVEGVVIALGAYYAAMKLIAVYTAFTSAINAMGNAMILFRAKTIAANTQMGLFKVLMGSPFVLTIVVAAALLALAQVYRAVMAIKQAMAELNNLESAQRGASSSQQTLLKGMQDLRKNGTPSQKKRANAFFKNNKFSSTNDGLASGTDFWKGGPTWVGEKGPEILNLPRGSQVIPNNKVDKVGSNVTVQVNMNGIMARSRSDLRDITKDMIRSVNEELKSKQLDPIGGGAI